MDRFVEIELRPDHHDVYTSLMGAWSRESPKSISVDDLMRIERLASLEALVLA